MTKPITDKPGMTVHLDEKTVTSLAKLQEKIISQSPDFHASFLTIPVLARMAINSHCAAQEAAEEQRSQED